MRIYIVVKNYFFVCTLVLSGIAFLFSSCANIRQLTYMQGKFDTAKLSQINASQPVIRTGDLLSIIVFSDNPEATKLYNQSLMGAGTSGSQVAGSASAASGYQVDVNGDIVFQGLGLLHVAGLTKEQLKDTLDIRLKPFLTNPYYNIRFLNYKFTMLGEIGRPGSINIPGERINLLEAIALAGDMTFYGRRDNVLIVRESNGKREFGRVNLLKPEVMTSPYFYLQQNDLVIVEATNKKAIASDQVTLLYISVASTVVSTFAILYSIFRK
jgi:polysaccharide export outer membrane protein